MAATRRKNRSVVSTPPMQRVGWRAEGECAKYYGKNTIFSVHEHIDDPGKWFVSCYELIATRIELKEAKTLEDAKRLAPVVLRDHILRRLEDINESLKTLNKE